MLIKEQLQTLHFSSAEQVTVDFLLHYPEKIADLTIQALAKQTFNQPSTIVRLAKKMNFNGWKDLKKAYLEEWAYLSRHFTKTDANLPFNKTDSIMTITKKMASLEQSAISDIYSLLEHQNLAAIKKMLLESNTIRIFSQNANLLISKDFALKMNRIGKQVLHSDIKGEERYEAYTLTPKDCAIFISYTGENKSLLAVNTILKKNNVPTIAITSIGDNTLSRACTCFLPITTREKLYSKIGIFTSNISIIYLLDVLYAIVFSANYDNNLRQLREKGRVVDKRMINTDIMKEN